MVIQFESMTGERRKELVKVISETTGVKPIYKGAPSFEYQVGGYTVRKDGSVEAEDFADPQVVGQLLIALRAQGFIQQSDTGMIPEDAPAGEDLMACMCMRNSDSISLVFPKEGMDETAISNLKKLVEGKGWLIRMALEVEDLPIEVSDDALRFSWLPSTTPQEMMTACMHLIASLIKLAKKQKRVVLSENETDNPRYALRCLLLRLGFIGDEYKDVRKVLLKGIPGNGSSRNPKSMTPDTIAARQETARPGEPIPVDTEQF